MPRRSSELEKVVSTKLSAEEFAFLKRYAKIWYNNNRIEQPTISHILRAFVQMMIELETKRKSTIPTEPSSSVENKI